MAKLNVEVLDMVNGKITKIAYEGAEYAKVDGKAEVGDIVVNNRGHEDLTIGGYYSVLKVYDNETVRVADDVSDGHDIRKSLIYGPFRKISADKPTLEQRVGDLESDVAVLKSSDSSLKGEKKSTNTFKIGDTIKVVRNTASWGKKEKAGYHVGGQGVVKVGAIGEVTAVSGDFVTAKFAYGDVNGDSQRKKELRFDEIKLAEDTIEFEGATYRKVDREAREGDVVISTVEHSPMVHVGKPYKVIGINSIIGEDGHTPAVYNVGRTRETVDVYEPIEQAKYVPQEGDIVVVTGNTNHSANEVGDIGATTPSTTTNRIVVNVPGRLNTGDGYTTTCPNEVRKATPAEVEKYESAVKIASKPKLKAGDYVKFKRGISDTKSGKPYLIEVDPSDGELAFRDDVNDWCSIARSDEYEILSVEEAKWAKINRKPNEFKKGDVVRVVERLSSDFTVGTIGTVVKDEIDDYCRPTTEAIAACGKLKSYHPRVELVAPVESLFNA